MVLVHSTVVCCILCGMLWYVPVRDYGKKVKKLHFKIKLEAGESGGSNRSRVRNRSLRSDSKVLIQSGCFISGKYGNQVWDYFVLPLHLSNMSCWVKARNSSTVLVVVIIMLCLCCICVTVCCAVLAANPAGTSSLPSRDWCCSVAAVISTWLAGSS